MRDHKIVGLPVVEEDKLVGIITVIEIGDAFLDITGVRSPGRKLTGESIDRGDEEFEPFYYILSK